MNSSLVATSSSPGTPNGTGRAPVAIRTCRVVSRRPSARTGFTGGINWYRNFSRNWLEAEKLPLRVDGLPCLMLTAELDPILPPSAASQMPSLVGDLEMAMVKGSGHWTQQERPDEVNRLILDWLGRRFSFSKAKG